MSINFLNNLSANSHVKTDLLTLKFKQLSSLIAIQPPCFSQNFCGLGYFVGRKKHHKFKYFEKYSHRCMHE